MRRFAYLLIRVGCGVALLSFFPKDLFAADVYYLGGSSSSNDSDVNKDFSWEKRVEDLVDFKNYGEYGPDRSGRISGNVSVEVNTNNVYGNKDQSFLREGVYSVWEANINAQERLWDDYNFESQIFMRRTDDRRIENRKDVRIKQLEMKIYNPDNMLQFGDFYGELSQFTLGQSLEGFNLKIEEVRGQKYRFIAARRNEADWAVDQYQRNVFGGSAEYTYDGGWDFDLFDIGVQAVTSQDDKGSIDKWTSATDISNTVVSLDGEIRPIKNFGVAYEFAQSGYNSNNRIIEEDMVYGSAFRLQPELKVNDARLRYLYYYVTPKFYTDSGSAMPDKEQHQFSFDWNIMQGLSVSLIENYYWDHLEGSSRTMRTTNDEKYMSAYIRPLVKSPSFTIRPYVNVIKRDSDNLYNTLESDTNTYGISFNDSAADGRVNYGMGYEHREYYDIANHSAGTEIYNRIMGNMGFDLEFFGRRLYISDDISVDFRSTKTDNNADVTVANSVSCVYDFHDMCSFRAATNLQHMDGAGPGTNTTSTRNYAELIFTFDKKRSFRWILRAEENMVRPEDGSRGYTEERCIMKVMSNF